MIAHPYTSFVPGTLGAPPVPKCARGVTYGTSTAPAYLPGIAPGSPAAAATPAGGKRGTSAVPLLAGAALLGTVLWLAIG